MKRKTKRTLGVAAGLLTAFGSTSVANALERPPISHLNLSHHAKQPRHHHPETGYYYFPEDIYHRYPDRTYCGGYWGKGCTGEQHYHSHHHYRSR
jgi:hypothetical protein